MQKRQLKVSNSSLRNDSVLNVHWDEIVIGNPSCFHKLPNHDDVKFWSEYCSQRKVKLIVEIPVVFQKHMKALFRMVEAFIVENNVSSFIINDLGTLFEFYERGYTNTTKIILGQLLNFGYSSSPWSEKIIEDEEELIKRISQENNLEADYMSELLAVYNVNVIEVNPYLLNEKQIKFFREKNIGLNGVMNGQLVAIGRSCHAVRLYDSEVGNCQSLCNRPLEMDMIYKWERYDDMLNRIGIKGREVIPKFHLIGNSVWLKKSVQQLNIGYVKELDTISFDLRLQDSKEVIKNYHYLNLTEVTN
ncbi:hypothetical protein [Halalkalibacter urbisdiaboli]|uniref:hypothetical protein n=1 Tax=Halalkalibacter urbisdiaboli TaxID=1960589 RepID=UPI000B436B45|nr:hypothetical protein [Halalkalibacter urbisdiaboli]